MGEVAVGHLFETGGVMTCCWWRWINDSTFFKEFNSACQGFAYIFIWRERVNNISVYTDSLKKKRKEKFIGLV